MLRIYPRYYVPFNTYNAHSISIDASAPGGMGYTRMWLESTRMDEEPMHFMPCMQALNPVTLSDLA